MLGLLPPSIAGAHGLSFCVGTKAAISWCPDQGYLSNAAKFRVSKLVTNWREPETQSAKAENVEN
jgi:hypothetical protein